MRYFFRYLLAGIVLSIGCHAQIVARDVTKIYQELCSGCHGQNLEGGGAKSLLDGQWRYGGDQPSLMRTILNGYPELGMPAFAAAVSEAEAGALAGYIQEMVTLARDPQPREEQPLPEGVRCSEEHSYRIETVAQGFDVPWSLTFLPGGDILVTERVGRLRVIRDGQLLAEPVCDLPDSIMVRDEAGLMSVVADPDYERNGWIYLSYSDHGPNETAMTKVIRGRLRDGRLVDQENVLAIPTDHYQPSSVLFGGRLAFKGEHLFISVGERGMEEFTTGAAQDLSVPNGKIHRVFHDGRVPPDNPFVDEAGAFKSIWAYGVRNPQGLAINPVDGSLWESEHGPRGGDELNLIHRGRNYGWPKISYGMRYDGRPISEKTEAPGMEQPVINWTPSIAVSQIEFYSGDRFPAWKGNLFIGSLAQQKFIRAVIDGDQVIHREQVFSGLGRVRDIKTGPDGLLYLALELIGKPGRVVRLVPAD